MTMEQVLFVLIASFTLASAVMVVQARRLIHAAFWLIATLLGVAILYALLQATFLVVVQIVIYVGAIAVLFIFAIMLTQRPVREGGTRPRGRSGLAFLISLGFLGSLIALVFALPQAARLPPAMPSRLNAVQTLGAALLAPSRYGNQSMLTSKGYALPFEVASVLLLAALIGAVYAAVSDRGGKGA